MILGKPSFALIAIISAAFVWVMLGGGTGGSKPKEDAAMVEGTFPTLMECVTTIQKKAGPLRIMVDKPDSVAGMTAAGKLFGCSEQVTGTQGTYFYGWFSVPNR